MLHASPAGPYIQHCNADDTDLFAVAFYLFYDVLFFWSSAKHMVLCILKGLSHQSVNKT
jgi:hypothetical protein